MIDFMNINDIPIWQYNYTLQFQLGLNTGGSKLIMKKCCAWTDKILGFDAWLKTCPMDFNNIPSHSGDQTHDPVLAMQMC